MKLNVTERELISSFKSGHKPSFNAIYEAYWVYLYRLAFKLTRASDESEDLVQELFVDLWCKRDNINEERPIKPYLAGILMHKVLNRIRSKGAAYKRDFMTRVVDQYYKNGESNPIQDAIDFDDVEKWLEGELKRLSFTSQQIFKLSREENFTNRQIAEQLNISIKTVEAHLSKTMSTLRASLHKKTDLVYTLILLLFFFPH